MNNLIPEQRVDKNGKTTTRHVRPVKKDPAAALRLPSPALEASSSVQAPREIATEAWKALEAVGMKFSSVTIPNLTDAAIYDRSVLDQVVERYTEHADASERALWQGMISFTRLTHEQDADGSYVPANPYRRGLELFGFIGRMDPYFSGRTMDYYHEAAKLIKIAERTVMDHKNQHDLDALKATLLVRHIDELCGTAGKESWIRRDDISYLAENMGRVEGVIEGLVALRATDAQAVESLVGTPSALRDGAL